MRVQRLDVNLAVEMSRVPPAAIPLLCNDTRVPPSSSSIMCYWSKGGDFLRLQITVDLAESSCWVYDVSHLQADYLESSDQTERLLQVCENLHLFSFFAACS